MIAKGVDLIRWGMGNMVKGIPSWLRFWEGLIGMLCVARSSIIRSPPGRLQD